MIRLMHCIRKLSLLLLSGFLVSCGLETYYFLRQVPEELINRTFNTEATIILPPIDDSYYALNYAIFYRIYISEHLTESGEPTVAEMNTMHPNLASDYNAIFPSTDPTNLTANTNVNTLLKNRNYFELELDGVDINDLLSTNGGSLRILFPTTTGDYPVLSINNEQEIRLIRSGELISPEPSGDPFFRNTDELGDPANAINDRNRDVASRTGLSQQFAYASMYIVAVGLDPILFTPIYSKPTHISIFKLPDTN